MAGLVGITAGTAAVSPLGSVIIGFFSGIVTVLGVEFMDKVLKTDDPVGAVPVHGFSGAFGTIMVGLFAVDGGLFYGSGTELLVTQITGVLATFVWTVVTGLILFSIVKAIIGLRVSDREEEKGLDIREHGVQAYGDFMLRSGDIKEIQ
ncbi:MAG: ammonium transporter, Amt family [Clostridia bacterium]|nr:ammonium transporter, Amt family [Clostridia bacterium]